MATHSFSATTLGPATNAGVRLLLCPTTALYTVPFTLYSLLLSYRVAKLRMATNTPNTPGCCHRSSCCDPTNSACGKKSSGSGTDADSLCLATCAHRNYLENVPMAMILAAVAELNGADRKTLAWAMTALAALRFAHVECGLRREAGLGKGMTVGYWGTGAWMAGMVGWCAVLVRDYWGF